MGVWECVGQHECTEYSVQYKTVRLEVAVFAGRMDRIDGMGWDGVVVGFSERSRRRRRRLGLVFQLEASRVSQPVNAMPRTKRSVRLIYTVYTVL